MEQLSVNDPTKPPNVKCGDSQKKKGKGKKEKRKKGKKEKGWSVPILFA